MRMGGRKGRGTGKERVSSTLGAECRADGRGGLDLMTLSSSPGQKPRVRHSTECAAQAPPPHISFCCPKYRMYSWRVFSTQTRNLVKAFPTESSQYIPVRTQSIMKQMKPNIRICPHFYCDLEKSCCFK